MNTEKVIVSRDAVFHEDQFPFDTSGTIGPDNDRALPIVKIGQLIDSPPKVLGSPSVVDNSSSQLDIRLTGPYAAQPIMASSPDEPPTQFGPPHPADNGSPEPCGSDQPASSSIGQNRPVRERKPPA